MSQFRPCEINDFLEQKSPYLFRYCYAAITNPADAEDIAQRTLLTFFEKTQPPFAAKVSLDAFLFGIARKNILHHISVRSKQPPSISMNLNDHPVGDQTAFDKWQCEQKSSKSFEQLGAALDRLDRDLKDVIELQYWGELTYEQIAEVLGMTVQEVKYRLQRAREKIREALSPLLHP